MNWVRVDNRLIHGQVIEAWLPYTKSRMLVVANDDLARDALRQDIMGLAIPQDIGQAFVPVDGLASFLTDNSDDGEGPGALILLANCCDAMRAYDSGVPITRLNIGNLHYGPGKEQICAHVALSGEDRDCLKHLAERGVALDYRCVPNEPVQVPRPW